jgi:hypothetical protein
MNLRIVRFLETIALTAVMLLSLSFINVVNAALSPPVTPTASGGGASVASEEACKATQELSGVDCSTLGDPDTVAGGFIGVLVNLLTWVVGMICVVMIIYGGFRYVTSGGDSDATKTAGKTIIYSAVGLAVVLLSRVIVYFVFSKAGKL